VVAANSHRQLAKVSRWRDPVSADRHGRVVVVCELVIVRPAPSAPGLDQVGPRPDRPQRTVGRRAHRAGVREPERCSSRGPCPPRCRRSGCGTGRASPGDLLELILRAAMIRSWSSSGGRSTSVPPAVCRSRGQTAMSRTASAHCSIVCQGRRTGGTASFGAGEDPRHAPPRPVPTWAKPRTSAYRPVARSTHRGPSTSKLSITGATGATGHGMAGVSSTLSLLVSQNPVLVSGMRPEHRALIRHTP